MPLSVSCSFSHHQLQNGQLIVVPCTLIKRLSQHYISLPWGVDLILGRNGFIWITRECGEAGRSLADWLSH